MRRELIALLPVLGLSGIFVVNQSCATKSALEEVEKDLESPKENVTQAKENLREAKGLLGDARRILESARAKLDRHVENRALHTPPPPKEEVVAEPVREEPEYGTVRVGWCDTLWDISAEVYRNSLYWPAIYNLNRDKIGDDPWILAQGTVLRYKKTLTAEEKNRAIREAIEWDLRFRDRPRSPKCPPR